MGMLKLSNFLQAKFNIFLYTILGWSFVRLYMFILCKLYFFIKKEERNSIEKSVQSVIGWMKKKKDLENITRKVFSGIFSHYYEKIFAAFENRQKVTDFLNCHVSYKDISIIKKSLSKEKGVILITGHYGAIEYIPLLLAINDIKLSMIAKFKTPQLRKMAFKQADNFGVRMIDATAKGYVIKEAINELKQNRVLITQCDEIDEWRTSEKKTTFLGQVTGLDRTINLLHKRTGAEIVFGVLHRYNLDQYKFIAYSYEQMIEMIRYIPSITTGEIVLKVLEQFIYNYPEQWYEWKKYPDLINAKCAIGTEGRYIALPYMQPTFNINL
jgi:Kdo2-lipid IVA lauroyltransferase/acyltransferase